MADKDINPKISVKQTGSGRRAVQRPDLVYVQACIKNIENSGLTPEQVEKFKNRALIADANAKNIEGDMGILKDAKSLNAVEIAKLRTINFFRRRPTKLEVGIWEALRSPSSGVPPQDVRGTPDDYIVYN